LFVQSAYGGASAMDMEVLRCLNELDTALRELEMVGRQLEERIRNGQ